MKLVSKLKLFFGLMLALALSGAALSVWSAFRADHNLVRLSLANDVYDAHLRLSNQTYQLFKQYGDVLIVGRKDDGEGKAELIRSIRAEIANIRELIGQEIELVGDEEIEELTTLSEIELQIEQLIAELTSITRGEGRGDITDNWARLSRILDGDIDQDFRRRIEMALQEEEDEVAETKAEAQSQLTFHRMLSALFALLALLGGGACYVVLYKGMQVRLRALSGGAERLSSGDLTHRLDTEGTDELAGLARTLTSFPIALETGNRRCAKRTASLKRKCRNARSVSKSCSRKSARRRPTANA